jgi:hypothetical protein
LTINLTGINNNNDSITVSIESGNTATKKIGSNQSSCIFTPSDLMYLSINNGGNIILQLINKRTVIFNNKEYYFFNNLQHTKYSVKVKP